MKWIALDCHFAWRAPGWVPSKSCSSMRQRCHLQPELRKAPKGSESQGQEAFHAASPWPCDSSTHLRTAAQASPAVILLYPLRFLDYFWLYIHIYIYSYIHIHLFIEWLMIWFYDLRVISSHFIRFLCYWAPQGAREHLANAFLFHMLSWPSCRRRRPPCASATGLQRVNINGINM